MINILFVCSANICRSPAAEAILKKYTKDQQVYIDSCGIHCIQEGLRPDMQMAKEAMKRGYSLEGKSQAFTDAFFSAFDYIFIATQSQKLELESRARKEEDLKKIFLMTHFSSQFPGEDVPDPYTKGFEIVFDVLEEACLSISKHLLHAKK